MFAEGEGKGLGGGRAWDPRDLAIQATQNPNSSKVVLGKFMECGKSYTKVAAHFKASYFKLKNWRELSKVMTEDELWEVNKTFLEQQIGLGKEIILSHDPAKATGFFNREVKYLIRNNYKFIKDGWIWRAVK